MIFHQLSNSLNNNFNANFYKNEIWDSHFHKSFEMVYVITGKLKCCVDGCEYLLESGNFGICLPYDIHSYEPLFETNYWVCVFSEDYVRDFSSLTRGKSGGFKFECSGIISDFVSETLIYNKNPSRLLIKAALYAVCDEYLKKSELSEKSRKLSGNIAAITDYVEENYTKNIKLSDISRLLGYDYNYVSRYFNSIFKMSFPEFLMLYRLEKALELLEQSNKKILEIALESGFQSVRSFNECFKNRFNMTPQEYKKARSIKKVKENN